MDRERLQQETEEFDGMYETVVAWALEGAEGESDHITRRQLLAAFLIKANELGQDGITLDNEGHISHVWSNPDI